MMMVGAKGATINEWEMTEGKGFKQNWKLYDAHET